MDDIHHGACFCGAVKLTATGEPKSVGACHCPDCRRHTGAPVAVYADYLAEQIQFHDAVPALFESSPGTRRGFCNICGTTMTYEADNIPHMLEIHVGVFDDPAHFTPTANEKVDTKLPWISVSTA